MWVSEATQEKYFSKLLARPDNQKCADCNSKSPTWASIDYGVLVCLNCSGAHRALGPSVTRVKSTKLDTWMIDWFEYMNVGNEICNRFWEANLGLNRKPNTNSSLDQIKKFVTEKYVKRKFVVPGEKDPVTLSRMRLRGELENPTPKQQPKPREPTPEEVDRASRQSNPDDNLWDFEDASPVSKPSNATTGPSVEVKKVEVDLMEFSEPSQSQPKRAHSLEHSVPPITHNPLPVFHGLQHYPFATHHSTPPQVHGGHHNEAHFYQHPQHNVGHTNLHFGMFQHPTQAPMPPMGYYNAYQQQPISMNMNISMNMYANSINITMDPPTLKMTESYRPRKQEPFADFDEFRNLKQK